MQKHFSLKLWVLGILLCLNLSIALSADQNAPFNSSSDTDQLEKLWLRWSEDQNHFRGSTAYTQFISDDVLIHGMGSTPNFRYGKALIYYNYSDPTIFFLPPNHQGGILSLAVFYHGDRHISEVNINLNNKPYVLSPEDATDEYVYNSYLLKRPVWNPGLALTIAVTKEIKYVVLKSDSKELLFSSVTFAEGMQDKRPSVLIKAEKESSETGKDSAPLSGPVEKPLPLPDPEKETSPFSAEEPKGAWIRYRSPLEGFSFDYPGNWQLKEHSGQSLLELILPQSSRKLLFTKDIVSGDTLKDFAAQNGNLIGMISQKELYEEENRLRQSAKIRIGDANFYLEVLYVKKENVIYTLTAIAGEESKDDFQKEIDAVLDSFTL